MSPALRRSSRLIGWSFLLTGATAMGDVAKVQARTAGSSSQAAPATDMGAPSSAVFLEADELPASRTDPQTLDQSEMLSLVRKYASEIFQAVTDGERQREQAIHRKDSIKLACIQDRLSSMKLVKKLSDNRLRALERPAVRADALHLRHEFRGVEMAHQRMMQLHRELKECVGSALELAMTSGVSDGTTAGPTPGDPSSVGVEIPPPDRPAPASVYK